MLRRLTIKVRPASLWRSRVCPWLLVLSLCLLLAVPALASGPQIQQGSNATVPFTNATAGADGSNTWFIYGPSGSVVASGSGTTGASNGYGLSYYSHGAQVAVYLPASAPVGSNYRVLINSGYDGGYFDVVPAPVQSTGSISVSPASITVGQSATLSWTSSQIANINVSGQSGYQQPSGSVTVTPTQAQTYTYTLTGQANGQAFSTSCQLVVGAAPAAPAPLTVAQGGTAVFSVPAGDNGLSGDNNYAVYTYNSTDGANKLAVSGLGGADSGWKFSGSNPSSMTISCPAAAALRSDYVIFFVLNGTKYVSYFTVTAAAAAPPPSPPTGGSTAPGAPGVSASLSPYVIGAGGSSVLRWDTSGASTVSVTGVPNPSTSGTANVSPTGTTTYTVTATNAQGSTTMAVTLTVGGPNAPGGDGASSYDNSTNISFGDGTPFQLQLPTIPGLTLPTVPPLQLPTIPTIGLPGNLKIGIPGIGSIGIPTGWLSQILNFAIRASAISTGMTGAVLTSGMNYAAYTTNLAVADVKRSVDGTKASIEGTALTTQQKIDNASTIATQTAYQLNDQVKSTISSTAKATQDTINLGTATVTDKLGYIQQQLQNTLTALETKVVNDFKALLAFLFIPSPASFQLIEGDMAAFLNWGPYSFVHSLIAVTQTPAQNALTGQAPSGAINAPLVNAAPGSPGLAAAPPVVGPAGSPFAGDAGLISIPVMSVNVNPGTVINLGSASFDPHAQGVWYDTGQRAAFDFSPMTATPAWAVFRFLEGALVWLTLPLWVIKKYMPTGSY